MTKYQYSQLGHNIKYSDGVISLATSSKIELFRYPIVHLLFSASAMCFLKTQGSQRSTHTRAGVQVNASHVAAAATPPGTTGLSVLQRR